MSMKTKLSSSEKTKQTQPRRSRAESPFAKFRREDLNKELATKCEAQKQADFDDGFDPSIDRV